MIRNAVDGDEGVLKKGPYSSFIPEMFVMSNSVGADFILLHQTRRTCQYKAIVGGAGNVAIGTDSSIANREFAAQGCAKLCVEHLPDASVIGIVREGENLENCERRIQYIHGKIATYRGRLHRCYGSTKLERATKHDIRIYHDIATLHAYLNVLCRQIVADGQTTDTVA